MQHVVTRPQPPFRSADGRLEIHQIPSWLDNLIWLAVCTETGAGVVIDGPEAKPVLDYCEAQGIELTGVLNTHTHPDHIGVNKQLIKLGRADGLSITGAARVADRVPGLTRGVDEGDTVQIGAVTGQVWLTEGHLNGHLSFLFDDLIFCGDTLIAGGCGFLFDGPAAKLHHSLQRIVGLDPATRICGAHEYTQDNLRFAWFVEPGSPALKARVDRVWALRAEGGCAVPSTVGEERDTNPFVRGHVPALQAGLQARVPGVDLRDPVAIFAATRALKDTKQHREAVSDADLGVAP